MKHIRVVACMFMLALAGCDNNDKAPIAAKNDAPAAQPAAEKKAEKDTAQLQKPVSYTHLTLPTNSRV